MVANADRSPIGRPGQADRVTLTVDIDMTDQMRFAPSSIVVHEGSTVRLRISNKGSMVHELILGTEADLAQHNEMMKTMPAMTHDGPGMVTLKANDESEIVWEFLRPGILLFGCLQPGHYDAGMLGAITVLDRDRITSTRSSASAPASGRETNGGAAPSSPTW